MARRPRAKDQRPEARDAHTRAGGVVAVEVEAGGTCASSSCRVR